MDYTDYTHNFQQARFRADLEQVWARLTGKSIDLLDFEDVRQRLHMELTARRTLRDIPVAAIVGSVGRSGDFTRDFLPLTDRDEHRWAEIHYQLNESTGLPPIEVYQVGEVYFVLDGNHRVSVARDTGATDIEAYVTEVRSRVPLTPDTDPRELILKARHVEFLERTQLDQLRPGVCLEVTRLGSYAELERHIRLHRYILGVEQRREVSEAEAATDWYDHVYLPVSRVIRERGALKNFPGRTETDLYLVVSGYRPLLEEYLEWDFESGASAPDEPAAAQAALPNFIGRVLARLQDRAPAGISGVLPGEWRREQAETALGSDFRLFTTLLVPVTGAEGGWAALDLAIAVARREHGRVLGLYVTVEQADEAALTVKAEFEQLCQAAGILGRLAIERGEVAERICERSAWVDLTVLRLAHPPPAEPWAKFSSGFRTLVRKCASPLLVTPHAEPPRLDRALVAYNGSRQAEAALQTATYLAQRWGVTLTVVSVRTGGFEAEAALGAARAYVTAQGLTATYLSRTGPVAETVLQLAAEQNCDLVIMGGYGRGPFLEIALGSTVDEVLRRSHWPTLICP